MPMFSIFKNIFSSKSAFDRTSALSELEEALIVSDAGMETVGEILGQMKKAKFSSSEEMRSVLMSLLTGIFAEIPAPRDIMSGDGMKAIMFLGVNGTGKTTTLAKLAHHLKLQGKRVMVAAGDTFRAAAIEQLAEWCKRIDVPLVKQKQFSDSSSVIFDALTAGLAQQYDYLLIDTAGRMHTNDDLMRELEKIDRTILKKIPESSLFRLMAVDSQTGQNSFLQAQKFGALFRLDGFILTKLDSGFKGGIALRIARELKLPILFRTSGESIGDIATFNSGAYIESLF